MLFDSSALPRNKSVSLPFVDITTWAHYHVNIWVLFYKCSFFRSSLFLSFLTVDFILVTFIIIMWQYCSSSAFAALKINTLLFSEYRISCLWVHYTIQQTHVEKLPKLLFYQWKYSCFCFKDKSFHLQMDLLLHLFLNSLSFICDWKSLTVFNKKKSKFSVLILQIHSVLILSGKNIKFYSLSDLYNKDMQFIVHLYKPHQLRYNRKQSVKSQNIWKEKFAI